MGSLKDLVSEVFDLVPPLNVDPGTVLLTLKFGAPKAVVRPGRKLRRGKGLPLTMAPQGMLVSTEDIPIGKYVENVVVDGPYPVAGVSVDITIAVNSDNDYGNLISYVAEKGINFADLLELEVANQLDRLVRDQFAGRTAVDIYERGNLTQDFSALTHLLGGLFSVRAVMRVHADMHPEFVRAREAAARSAADLAEKNLALEHAQTIDRELNAAQDLVALEAAARRGLTLHELENPDLVSQRSAQDHEVRIEVLRQMDSIRRAGGSELVGEALKISSLGAGSAAPELAPVARGGWSIANLERDRALAALWRKSGLPGEPIGLSLSLSERSDDATVIIVSAAALEEPARTEAIDIYGQRFSASKVVAIDDVADVGDVVLKYMISVEPSIASAQPSLRVFERGDDLIIEMSSGTARLKPLLKAFTEPDSEAMAPLRDLLDTESLILEIAGG